MAKKQRYYTVWQGRQTGVFTTWEQCKAQVDGIAGARYKAFDSLAEAQQALRFSPENYISRGANAAPEKHQGKKSVLSVDANGITVVSPECSNPPIIDALAVDAACSGNPGVMEYQGIYIPTRTQVFHYRSEYGTNNIGEFLAIVHGLAYLKRHNLQQMIYSDSVNAMNWVRQGVCKSKLPLDSRTADLWDFVHRAEQWLRSNSYTTEIRKWDTDHWGEIPADFGRK